MKISKIPHALLIIFCTFFFYASDADAERNSSFKRVQLKYGISFEKPLGWVSLDSKKFRQFDNMSEAITGTNQANNEILTALNCYTGSKNASAKFRISVRHKKSSASQKDLSLVNEDDLKYLLHEAINESIRCDKAIGSKTNINTIKSSVVKVSGFYSLLTIRDIYMNNMTSKTYLHIIPLDYATIKISYSYDKKEEHIFKPILMKMDKSVKILNADFK